MNYLPAIVFSLFTLPCLAQPSFQVFPSKDYPRDYFRDPLDIPIKLAANFGELRTNHYHMGLDIRTQQKVNLPVYAAADGYISHVKIEPEGFGQAIYICHPNGYTTLYAHLNRFCPALAAYVKEQQYKRQSWSVFLDIPPGLFPVKKGDFIAWSGSTGGSEGPHLHFEIRRTSDDVNLNPLLFGLPVPDYEPPRMLRLAVYDRTRSVYEQAPLIFAVHRIQPAFSPDSLVVDTSSDPAIIRAHMPANTIPPAASVYSIGTAPITIGYPRVSLGIGAFDTQTGSNNPNGIYQAILDVDGKAVSGFQMDRISYDNTRHINAHIDYKTKARGGPWLQNLFELPGYPEPSIYRPFPHGCGVIDLSDGLIHFIQIELQDPDGNSSSLAFGMIYKPSPMEPSAPASGTAFYPGMLDGRESPDCAFYIPENGLYDSVHIADTVVSASLFDAVSAIHRIGFPWVPLNQAMLVRLRPAEELPSTIRDRVVMVCLSGDRRDVVRPEWKDGWASAHFREFGDFQLVRDEEPPVIRVGFRPGAVLTKAARISFTVKDNLGVIRACRAELDPPAGGGSGKWLCFTNDKGLAYIYTFDEHCPRGKHILKITAEDEAGNKTTKEYPFTR